jgi:hypothetical protein
VTDHEAALSPLAQAPFDDGQWMIALDRMAAATCKCGYGSTGYALSYGKKYCERFQLHGRWPKVARRHVALPAGAPSRQAAGNLTRL